MKIAKVILCLVSLTSCSLFAQEAKVTPLMSKDLEDIPGKEGLMITVEYPPGRRTPKFAVFLVNDKGASNANARAVKWRRRMPIGYNPEKLHEPSHRLGAGMFNERISDTRFPAGVSLETCSLCA